MYLGAKNREYTRIRQGDRYMCHEYSSKINESIVQALFNTQVFL